MALIETSPFRGDDPLQQLLDRYLLSGDEEAMEEVVLRTRGKLLAVARRIGKPQDAEDAVQTAYFSLIRKRGERLEAPVLPWLLTAVVRIAYRQKAVNQRQHQIARRLAKPTRAPSPLPEIANAEEAARARMEISRLPAKYRDPAVLRLLMGLSTAETAELLDRPEATVRTHLHRARLLLRSRWPAPVAHGVFILPWLVADAGRSLTGPGAGGLVPLPAVLVTVVASGFLGGLGGARLNSGDRGEAPAPVETIETIRADRGRLRGAEVELAAHRDRLVAVRDSRRALQDRLKADLSAGRPTTPGFPVPVEPPEYRDLLALVDWAVLGENVVEFSRLLGQLAERIRTGADVDPDWATERVRRNGNILREAVKVWDRLPAHDQSLPHTHPVFMANAIAAALDYLDMPLTSAQKRRFVEELRLCLEADRKRLASYDETSLSLTRLREESELKEKHLAAMRAALTDGQRGALWPDGIENRVGLDLFSPGILWSSAQRLKHVDCTGREGFVAELSAGMKDAMHVPQSGMETLTRIVADWAAQLPPENFAVSSDALVREGIPVLADVHVAARSTENLLLRIEAGLPKSADRTQVVRYSTGVILPRVRVGKDEVK